MSTSPDKVDFTILGAGIAGLSMADELLIRGKSVLIIDSSDPGSGSSGAPLVLINPATGRRAKMVANVEASLDAVTDLLNRVKEFTGDGDFYIQNGVLRPALDKELADDFKRSPSKYDWPDQTWIKWLDEKTFAESYRQLPNQCGGLVISRGYTVDAPAYITQLNNYLLASGLIAHYNTKANIIQNENESYDVILENGQHVISSSVIYAIGSAASEHSAWNFLPFKTTKGQLLDLKFESNLPLHASISSMGYFAYMPSAPKRLVVGSTYEHSYDDLSTSEKGRTTLYNKLDRTLPGLSKKPHKATMWAGERVSTKDHKPVIGEHPLRRRSYLIGGLGSKGMVQGRYLAKQLADYILDSKPIDSSINLNRFQSF